VLVRIDQKEEGTRIDHERHVGQGPERPIIGNSISLSLLRAPSAPSVSSAVSALTRLSTVARAIVPTRPRTTFRFFAIHGRAPAGLGEDFRSCERASGWFPDLRVSEPRRTRVRPYDGLVSADSPDSPVTWRHEWQDAPFGLACALGQAEV